MEIIKMELKSLLNKLNPLKWSRSRQLVAAGVVAGAVGMLLLSGNC